MGAGFAPIPWSVHRQREWASDTERSNTQKENFQFAIEAAKSAEMVGTLNTHRCTPRTGVFSYGVQVFPDHRRRGYASEAITLVLAHYFQERRYQKCNVTIYDYSTWIGAYNGERLVGFVNVAWDGGVHAVLLDTIVKEPYRHRGIGTRLVTEALAAVADHPRLEWVHVDSSPELMAGFYGPAGFRATSAGLVWVPDLRETT